MGSSFRGLKRYIVGDRQFYKLVFSIVIPVIIQNSITSFVGLLDNVMVGQLGTEQMSGVAIANQLIFIFNICIFGGISGASIYGAQFYGAKDYESMRAAMRIKLYICLGIFVIVGTALLVFDTPLISLFLSGGETPGAIAATLEAGEIYVRTMIWGLLPFALAQAYTATMREAGETMMPMISGVAAVITNVIFNYILIFGKFGAPEMGIKGAAVATVISRYLELAIVVIAAHWDKNKYFYIDGVYRTLKVPGLLVKRIAIRGLPLLANEALWSVGMSFMTQIYSVRGLDVVASTNIAGTVSNLFNTIVFAMGNAVAIIVGQALGADDTDRAKTSAWRLVFFGIACAIVLGVALAIASPFIPYIYNTSEHVRGLSTSFMLVLAATMFIKSFAHCCYFTLRSGGKTVMTFVFDCLSIWVVNIPVLYSLVHFSSLGIVAIYLVAQMVDIVKCIFGAILLYKGVWINNIAAEATKA